MEKNTDLKALADHDAEMRRMTERTAYLVANALTTGASWAEIGKALGVSKQTAHARYGKLQATEAKQEKALTSWRGTMATLADQDATGRSVTPSIFSDEQAPATRAAEIHGQRTVDVFQQFAADRKAAKAEDQERADFWEAKRKYVVTVDGAIYSPRGENGWELHKVLRNVNGRNFQQSYSDMSELIAANEGLLYVSRDKYDGLVQNAAKDRECWIMAATERENSVTARPELAEEIKAMDEKLAAIQKQLKANRNKKGPAYKTGG